ncbi:MAG: Diaminopropionate ammonia-lyase [Desulfovibrio sp.]
MTIGALQNPAPLTAPAPEFLRRDVVAPVLAFHQSMPGYEKTPLMELKNLARKLGLKNILVKDESKRFGLNAFKGLGGSYAVFRVVCERLGLNPKAATFADLQTPERKAALADTVFVTATDGNHGKGVSWAAGLLGCRAVVYMPKGSSEIRAEAIRNAGKATATITALSYDDTVRLAASDAAKNGWTLIQDTSWEGYEEIPARIIQGYTTLAAEAVEQMENLGEVPTHVFLQAGVGAMAGGILGYLADVYARSVPVFAIAEPQTVACIFASAAAGDGQPHPVAESGPTIMAGLNCGEPCTITWPILRDFPRYYFSCPDFVAAEGMRIYANPTGGDAPILSGESGAATLGLLVHLMQVPALRHARENLGLDENAVVFLVNTEGDTDPACYADIVHDGAYSSPLL